MKNMEEKLRENCCMGDEGKVKLLLGKGVNVNAANCMNGWTPLHWAAKRGHKKIVELLLQEGASKTLKTSKGETAGSLAKNPEIKEMIATAEDVEVETSESLPIVPNYIKNPGFPYVESDNAVDEQQNLPFGLGRNLKDPESISSPVRLSKSPFTDPMTSPPRKTIAMDSGKSFTEAQHYINGTSYMTPVQINSPLKNVVIQNELVLKVRVANSEEDDFIEIELDFVSLTFDNLIKVCCDELGIQPNSIRKVRKLPNTIVRKDKDVARLQEFQELEFVLH